MTTSFHWKLLLCRACFISPGHETRVATTLSGSEKFKVQEGSNGRRPYNGTESKQTTPDQTGRVGARECQPEDGSPGQQTPTGESFVGFYGAIHKAADSIVTIPCRTEKMSIGCE